MLRSTAPPPFTRLSSTAALRSGLPHGPFLQCSGSTANATTPSPTPRASSCSTSARRHGTTRAAGATLLLLGISALPPAIPSRPPPAHLHSLHRTLQAPRHTSLHRRCPQEAIATSLCLLWPRPLGWPLPLLLPSPFPDPCPWTLRVDCLLELLRRRPLPCPSVTTAPACVLLLRRCHPSRKRARTQQQRVGKQDIDSFYGFLGIPTAMCSSLGLLPAILSWENTKKANKGSRLSRT
ncbi:hypothetical protein U9M48_008259 [Paspalum notatum var. saurae]|uniref:Uncharacterized protein n=1 Tax=Paspalum notatum var. saurae TaxID=547442 RepID=A0AAQ3SNN7_PASNO